MMGAKEARLLALERKVYALAFDFAALRVGAAQVRQGIRAFQRSLDTIAFNPEDPNPPPAPVPGTSGCCPGGIPQTLHIIDPDFGQHTVQWVGGIGFAANWLESSTFSINTPAKGACTAQTGVAVRFQFGPSGGGTCSLGIRYPIDTSGCPKAGGTVFAVESYNTIVSLQCSPFVLFASGSSSALRSSAGPWTIEVKG